MSVRLPKLSRRSKLTLLCSTGVIFLISLVTLVTGRVEGTEFAPSNFQMRAFTFWEIPFIRLQVTPISRTPTPLQATNYIISRKAIALPKKGTETWHLVTIQRGLNETTLADAEILTTYLNLKRGSTFFWEQWSRDHWDAAVVFWPVVQKLAQRELYLILPELFELAQKNPVGTDLQIEIDRWLPEAYARLAVDLREAKQGRLAIEVLEDGLSDYPDSKILLEEMARAKH